jgi:putative flippase GtrA
MSEAQRQGTLSRMVAIALRHKQFLTFCAVGASGVLVNMVVFGALSIALEATGSPGTWLAANAAVVGGWAVSVATNFLLNDWLTFRHRAADYQSSRRRRVLRYYVMASVGLALQSLVFNALYGTFLWMTHQWSADQWMALEQVQTGMVGWVWLRLVEHWLACANLVGIGLATIVNYLMSKRWVFR